MRFHERKLKEGANRTSVFDNLDDGFEGNLCEFIYILEIKLKEMGVAEMELVNNSMIFGVLV